VRVVERSTINTELILYNGPHNPPNPNGDFPVLPICRLRTRDAHSGRAC
jgi:hypothetical protein